jgi:transglutaminase-like putative cysteine protease
MSYLKKIVVVMMVLCFVAISATSQPASASQPSKETLELIKKAGDREQYPDANAIVILDKTDVEFNSDGTGTTRNYSLVKILTQSGLESYGDYKIGYYRAYDTVRVELARVVKADGSAVDVPDDMIKDINSTSSEAMNIYEPDAKTKVITFRNLEIGDCIEYYTADSTFHAPIENEFDGMAGFQSFDPIIRVEYNISAPKDKALRHMTRNGKVNFAQKEKGNRILYSWWADNVPRIISEPAMPALQDVATIVSFTTIKSWEDMSRWWNRIAETKYAMNDALRAEVASLTAGKQTKDEKIDAIYRFVAQKVRYMGLGTGKKKGLEPKPVTETYETKYGVCRDVAALMVAMLREAKIESEIVLTGVGYNMPKEMPVMSFNHAIVAIKNDNGTYTYADPTIKNSTAWLPAVEMEQQVLLCTKQGNTLTDTPHSPAEENMGSIKATSNLTESGLFTSEVTISTKGIYDLALRGWAKAMPPAQVKQVWSYLLSEMYPGTRLTSLDFSDADDLHKPFELKLSYQIDNYPTEAGKFVLMKSPVSLGFFEIISKYMLASASLPERKYPWVLGFSLGADEEETINLPAGLQIKSVPDAVSKKLGPIEYKMIYNTTSSQELAGGGTQIKYQKRLLIDAKQMSPEEYAQLKQVLLASSKAQRGEIIMLKDKQN